MQIDAKTIEFSLDYGVQKNNFLKRHKFQKLPLHSLFENQLNKLEFKILILKKQLMKPKVALPKQAPMNHVN
jgi:hypothetical protein